MKMTLHYLKLPLAHEFAISRACITTQPTLIVELEHCGIHGYGEVTENTFYGHTFQSMTATLNQLACHLDEYANEAPADVWPHMNRLADGDTFALSALDMAAHDLHGRLLKIPTWQDWGLTWDDVPESSYTIGIDSIDNMVAKLKERPNWNIYKIKLGTPQDLEIVAELRQHTDAVFRVDANCGWTVNEAIANSKALIEFGVEFIEQPLPIGTAETDKRRLFSESALPIIADEDCQVLSDIARCDGLFHGVNIKICKCGGLTPALTMLRNACDRGMATMVGCMIESSIGISGAAQLLPLLDYADLDGAVLLKDDPAHGVTVVDGRVTMSRQPGCGGELLRNRLPEFSDTSVASGRVMK